MLFFITIIFSLFVGISEIDIVVPSFPQLQEAFNLSAFKAELILSLNLIFHCIASIYSGTLGDKYGKKQVALYGFAIFILGSLTSAVAPAFEIVLLGRILQGIGSAPAIVLGYVIAMEKYPKSQEKTMGILNGVIYMAISLAPVFGSYITLYFGWKGNFWLLFCMGIIAIIMVLWVVPNDKNPNNNTKVSIREYLPIFKNKLTVIYITMLCMASGAYYAFVGLAPILYIKDMGVSLNQFGFYVGALTLTFGIFSIVSGYFIKWFGKRLCFYISFILVVGFVVFNIIIMVFNIATPLNIILVELMRSIGFVIPYNIVFVMALETIPMAKGKISAVISVARWIFTVIGIQSASYFYTDTYMAIGVMTTSMVAAVILLGVIVWMFDPKFKAGVTS